MAYTKYSLTPANNTAAPPDGAPEGMLPSAVNDTMRDMMAQIRDVGDGVRDGTYTMTTPKITGGTITGATINNTTIGATTATTGKFTTLTNSALTSGRVTYAGASGLLSDSANLTFSGTQLNVTGLISTSVGATTTNALNINTTSAGFGSVITHQIGGVTKYTAGLNVFTGTGEWGVYDNAAASLRFNISSTGVVDIGVTGLAANANGATGKLVLRKPNEASGNNQITRMLDFAPYYPGYDEAVVKASISSGVDTGTQNGQLGFMVATGGVLYEKIRLLANGNVGIGTSSPVEALTVNGAIAVTGSITGHGANRTTLSQEGVNGAYWQSYGANISTYGTFRLRQASSDFSLSRTAVEIDSSGNLGLGVAPSAWTSNFGIKGFNISNGAVYGATNDMNVLFNSYYNGTNFIYSTTAVATKYTQGPSGQHQWFNAPSGTAGNAITFTQAMTLDANSSLFVGTTSFTAGGKGFVVRNDNAGGTYTQIGATSTSAWDVAYFYNPNGLVGSITVSGSATAYNTSSDQRLKTNVVDAPSGNIDNIKVRSFNWIADGSHQEYGMIAQELIEVAPYAVNKPENPDEMMGVDYSKLVPMMIKEIQDLKQRIKTLENK